MPQDRGPGRPHLLRTLNDRLALDLLLAGGPLTRRQVSDRTGLSRPTASLVLARLEAAGVVAPVGVGVAGGRGPQATLYGVPADAVLGAAVDVGRDVVRAEVVDVRGAVAGTAQVARTTAPAPSWRALREALAVACADAGTTSDRLSHAVVGVGGAYDPRADRLANSAHLPGWSGPRLAAGLERRLGLRVVVENDANLALCAERTVLRAAADPRTTDGGAAPGGAADDAGGTARLWFGDGVGLAVEVGGRIHRGATGRAGEIGYVLAPAPFGDGRRDLQALLGAGALEVLAAGYGLTTGGGPGGDDDGTGSGEGPDAHRVTRLLRDAVVLARSETRGAGARTFLGEAADLLAAALEPVTAVLDPATVVLGGPAGPAGGTFLADLVTARLRDRGRWFGRVVPAAAPDAVLAGCREVCTALTREVLLDRVAGGSEQVAT